ncbi:MAG TPA: DUF481 domain-containing protein [Candidatus Limnocylindria bacterium]|nr:DUF481 domain-containing protein [Candidatus Limnocylindria bacterium]
MRCMIPFGLLLCFAAPAFGDQLFLNNGDRISGEVQIDADIINVTSPLVGQLKVPRTAVTKIVMEKATRILVSGKVVDAISVTFGAHDATVHLHEGRDVNAPASAVMPPPLPAFASRSIIDTLLRPWNTSFDAGFTAARGNTAFNNLHFGLRAVETGTKHRVNLTFTSFLAQTNSSGGHVTTANAIRSGGRYEFNVSDHAFAFGLVTFDSDQLQHLDLRSVAGGGLGFRLAENKTTMLDVFSGGTFDRESFSDHSDRNSGELLVGEEMSHKFSARTSVTERLIVFPNFTSPGQYRITFDSSIVLKLNNWLGWQSSLTGMYLTNPVVGSRNHDVLVTTGLRFTFGQERVFKPRSKIAPLSN